MLRPTVALAVPWVYVCTNWFIVIRMTAKYTVVGSGEHAAEGAIAGLLPDSGLVGISLVNALFLAVLYAEGRVAWKEPSCVRRGQLTGVLFCAVNVLLLQWGALLAHDPLLGT